MKRAELLLVFSAPASVKACNSALISVLTPGGSFVPDKTGQLHMNEGRAIVKTDIP